MHSNYKTFLVAEPILYQLIDKTVPATQDANFTCTGQAYGDVNISWFRGRHDQPLPDKAYITNTITPYLITSVLTIPYVLSRDEARYRCRLTNSAGSTNSNRARLTIRGETVKC